MKKSLLWFGLAIPAAVWGGVTAFFRMKNNTGHKLNGRDHNLSVKLNRNKKDLDNDVKVQTGSELVSASPDLDKGLNSEHKPKEITRRRKLSSLKKPDKARAAKKTDKKVYVGAKGGKYYLNEKGDKVYLKK